METFGQRLQKLRKEKKMTQEALAEKLHVSPQAVSKWETDVSSPDIGLLGEIADTFNITIDELLGREIHEVTQVLEKTNKKDIKKMVLKIYVDSADGDVVRINFPIPLVLAFKDLGKLPSIDSSNDALKSINWETIFMLLEEGVVGELITVTEKGGDTVRIVVE